MPIWYCLVSSLVSSNTWFRSTDELCEAARAWQNIYLLGRWNLCVETDNLPSNLHHLSFPQISYPSTNIDKFILTSAKNRNVPFEHNIFCIVRFRGGQVNSLSLQKQEEVMLREYFLQPTKVIESHFFCFLCLQCVSSTRKTVYSLPL